jgi:hypothetical protein
MTIIGGDSPCEWQTGLRDHSPDHHCHHYRDYGSIQIPLRFQKFGIEHRSSRGPSNGVV